MRDDAATMDIFMPMPCLRTASFQSSVDQMIEQTMNRESKTKGGISLNRGAVQRWILTVHDRAKTLQTSREMTGPGIYDAESK